MEVITSKVKLISNSCFANHNFILCENGDLFSFGKNDFGQCGLGHTDDVKVPTKVMNNPNIVSIQLGVYHSFILESNGDLYVCGMNLNEEFGCQYDINITTFVKLAKDVKRVRTSKFTMIQTTDDKIFFLGVFLNQMNSTFTEIKIEGVESFHLGSDHCFFLKKNGEVFVLGSNYSGQIGLAFEFNYSFFPHLLMTDKNVFDVCCGWENSFILTRDEESKTILKSIGTNSNGALGVGEQTEDYFQIFTVSDFPNIRSVHCGNNHTIILLENGDVYSTGSNEDGELCLGNNKDVFSFTKINLSSIVSVATGSKHSIFLNSSGEIFVGGSNEWGQLGIGSEENCSTPVKLDLKGVNLLQNSNTLEGQTNLN